jgi:hypothetical protein
VGDAFLFYIVLGGVWFVLTSIVGGLMYASQVGPDQAASNLSLWVKKFGIEDPPQWLKQKSADRKVRRWALIALGCLLVIGGFLGGMIFNDYLRPQTSTIEETSRNRWEPLSGTEAAALRSELRKISAQHLSVLCAIPACADLAESLFSVTKDLKWDGTYEATYFSGGIGVGVALWSYSQKREDRQRIIGAIEAATKGRLKVSSNEWPTPSSPSETASHLSLVIERIK